MKPYTETWSHIQEALKPYTGGLKAYTEGPEIVLKRPWENIQKTWSNIKRLKVIHRRPSSGSQKALELYTRDPQVKQYTGEPGATHRRDQGVVQMSSKVVHRRP